MTKTRHNGWPQRLAALASFTVDWRPRLDWPAGCGISFRRQQAGIGLSIKGLDMLTLRKSQAGLYVDKSHHHWVVKDPDGHFWSLPPGENSWEHREPVDPTADDVDLEPVPGHYKNMLDLPF